MASHTLVTCEQLGAHLDDPLWVTLDCRFDLAEPAAGRARYQLGHVPGAHYADLDRDLARPPGPGEGRHPLPDPQVFMARVAEWGITPESQVVIYDDSGGGFAARAWWMLRWIGHDRAALLDGGYPAWIGAGGTVSQEPLLLKSEGEADGVTAGSVRHHWVTDSTQVANALGEGTTLLDARAAERFEGRVEPIDPVAGHVPGALNYAFTDSLAEDGRFRSPTEIRQRLQAVIGAAEGEDVIAMCGSGVTACHLLLAMEIAGLPGGRLYAGSWSEWVTDHTRPVATGPVERSRG
jgi:thiosulfate/3-mercaptopyruvate sulfurtransferase